MALAAPGNSERWISLGDSAFSVPERLLLAHARGEVIFVTGAGSSRPANLPDFKWLVRCVYERIEESMLSELDSIIYGRNTTWRESVKFMPNQKAEFGRFSQGEYDVVLGMLERRMDEAGADAESIVRKTVADVIAEAGSEPADMHRALMRLSDRGEATTILTTNYDLLLEKAASRFKRKVASHCIGAIPRPSHAPHFSGILHIHGALSGRSTAAGELILTDRDFGEFYLRRRVIPDLIYDATRLFNLVLVGYSANDAPMRYLLNAVAADNSRFRDVQERFIFVPFGKAPDETVLADWRGRGLTPIPYRDADAHSALTIGLKRWAIISAINGDVAQIEKIVRNTVRRARRAVADHQRDLIDHLYRRSNANERSRLVTLCREAKAEPAWLDAFNIIARERP